MGRQTVAALAALAALLTGCASSGDPTPTEAGPLQHYQMARMYFEQGRTDEALKEIDESLRRDDALPQVHFYKGYIYYSLGDMAKAVPCFEAAIQRDPYYTDARMYLAAAFDGLGRPQEALAELDKALANKTYPAPEKILVNKALILARQGQYEPALAALRQAIDLKPRYYRAHFESAQILETTGRNKEAIAAYVAAAPGYVDDAGFHFAYGSALFRARREAEAKVELKRAIELAPGSTVAGKASELLEVID
ncbi:MAG: tetratricopeptide repeat protein [Acidobacteria bacterium]|jgi:Tfp pilus assembly protein PilF|nr:tetratricopeptide repeat protein [Acidobacteriota bacterium]